MHQWNRLEAQEINACVYNQLTFDSDSLEKGQLLQQMLVGRLNLGMYTMKQDHYHMYKTQLTVDKIWNYQITIENIGETLQNINIHKDFLDKNPEAQLIKEKLEK